MDTISFIIFLIGIAIISALISFCIYMLTNPFKRKKGILISTFSACGFFLVALFSVFIAVRTDTLANAGVNPKESFNIKTNDITAIGSLVFITIISLIIAIVRLCKKNKKLKNLQLQISPSFEECQKMLIEKREELENCKNELEKRKNVEQNLIEARKELKKYRSGENNLEACQNEIKEAKSELADLQRELKNLQNDLVCENVSISDYENLNSEECKNKLAMLKNEITDLVKSDMLFFIQNEALPRKRINDNKKQILRCFTAECTNVIDNLTLKNVDTARSKITRAFENTNKIFETSGISLSKKILELKLEELSLFYAVIVKKEQECEEQKAIREQMVEEEKVRREIEREKAKIEKEEIQFKNEISKLMKYLQKASDIEKQLYIDKIKELEDKLKLVKKDKENVLQREQNTRAGFVYVISNIGSFGEDIYKIGMTRRLEPMDRVKELGDASVPFEFDVHAMIFSKNAPALENILHNTFRGKEVNKVNLRKEFYRVSLDEVEKVVKENYNATITFTKIAEALQYRETLKLEQAAS